MADPTPERTIWAPESLDRVADAVLALTRELWVMRDRQMALEAVLARHGIDAATAVDGFTPDADFQARLDTERDRLIEAVAGALDSGR
jgi:hypothetical protein